MSKMVSYEKMLFVSFPEIGKITEKTREENIKRVFTGGVRINNGMYRTFEEDRTYREQELKRKLP